MKCVKVPLKQINDTRLKLMADGQMNMDYRIKTSDGFGYIPVNSEIEGHEIVDIELEPMKKVAHNFSELLEGELSHEEIENLKTSFDTIGNIVILEIPDNLYDKRQMIGEAALKFTGKQAIYMKKSAVKGTTRVRDLEFLAGEDDSGHFERNPAGRAGHVLRKLRPGQGRQQRQRPLLLRPAAGGPGRGDRGREYGV